MTQKQMTNHRVELAKIALKYGRTRGQFIRENASPDADRGDLQNWSNAYNEAMFPCNCGAGESGGFIHSQLCLSRNRPRGNQ